MLDIYSSSLDGTELRAIRSVSSRVDHRPRLEVYAPALYQKNRRHSLERGVRSPSGRREFSLHKLGPGRVTNREDINCLQHKATLFPRYIPHCPPESSEIDIKVGEEAHLSTRLFPRRIFALRRLRQGYSEGAILLDGAS